MIWIGWFGTRMISYVGMVLAPHAFWPLQLRHYVIIAALISYLTLQHIVIILARFRIMSHLEHNLELDCTGHSRLHRAKRNNTT